MGWLNDFGNTIGLGDLDRSQNEFRDVGRDNFNLPGFADRAAGMDRQGNAFLDRRAPQAADSSFRQTQADALAQLQALAGGQNSLVGEQGRAAQAQLGAQQRQFAAGASPANQAMGQRLAMQNAARGGIGIDANTRMGQIAERNAALAGMGQLSSAARGQDIGLNQFNVGADLQQQGMNQQGWLGAQGLGLQNAQAEQQGGMNYEAQRGARFNGLLQNPTTGERALGAIVGGAQLAGQIATGGAGARGAPSGGGGGSFAPINTQGAYGGQTFQAGPTDWWNR